MKDIFEYLDKYSKLIGEGEFSLLVTIWTLLIIGLVILIRTIVAYNNMKQKLSKHKIASLRSELAQMSTIGYGMAIVIAFVMMALFRSNNVVWNYIVSQLIGMIGASVIGHKYIYPLIGCQFLSYNKKKKSNSTDKQTTVENNITINASNQEDTSADKEATDLDAMSIKLDKMFNENNKQSNKSYNDMDDDDFRSDIDNRVSNIEQQMTTIGQGLGATMKAVQDVTSVLSNFQHALDRIETRIDHMNDNVESLYQSYDEEKAVQARVRILRFNCDLILAKKHGDTLSKDLFDQTLLDIDRYNAYCASNPAFKNSITIASATNIMNEYQECLKNSSFCQ